MVPIDIFLISFVFETDDNLNGLSLHYLIKLERKNLRETIEHEYRIDIYQLKCSLL